VAVPATVIPDRDLDQRKLAMQITRSSIETQKGPADWFTGDVYIDALAAPAGSSTFASSSSPGRTTGTAPLPTASWPTSPRSGTTRAAAPSAGAST